MKSEFIILAFALFACPFVFVKAGKMALEAGIDPFLASFGAVTVVIVLAGIIGNLIIDIEHRRKQCIRN